MATLDSRSTSLLVVDVQQGFTDLCPGELPVPGALGIVPRVNALPPDPQEAAIAQVDPARFEFVDLTPFFCDERSCYPVVGGVLIYRDLNHLTTLFAETLAPYLQRALALP